MSVSSGSDITIPIQDSPPPPPSPYAGSNGGPKGNDASAGNKSPVVGVGGPVTIIDTSSAAADGDDAAGGKSTPEPRGDVTVTVGFVNEAYQDHSPEHHHHLPEKNGHSKMTNGQKKNSNGAISIAVPGEGSEKGERQEVHLNEAVNPELINMNILNTIPDKPNPEYGPYDNLDEYFVPVNQHKKFLRRSEKLYVTKDKRKETHWKKYICWLLGATILAAIVTVAVLAGIGLIPQKSPNHFDSVVGTTSATESASSSGDLSGDVIISSSPESSLPSSTEINTPPSVPVDATYVPMAADIHFHITDLGYESALNDKTSERFQQLAGEVQDEVKDLLKRRAGLRTVYSRVNEFAPGSVFVKMRVGWLDQAMNFDKVTMLLSNVTSVGQYDIMPIRTYEVVNLCKFNNKNGCSHNCSYDYIEMEFVCSCGSDDSLYLAEDKKTCRSMYDMTSSTTSEIPLLPEFSSYSPSPVSEEESSPAPPSPSTSSEEPVHHHDDKSHEVETPAPEQDQTEPVSQEEEEHTHEHHHHHQLETSSEEPRSDTGFSHEQQPEPETSTEAADLPSDTVEPVSHEHHHDEAEMFPILISSTTSTTTKTTTAVVEPVEPVSEEVIEPEHHHEEEHQPEVFIPVETTTPVSTSTTSTTPEPLPILTNSSEEPAQEHHHVEDEESSSHAIAPASSAEDHQESTEQPAVSQGEHHLPTGSLSSSSSSSSSEELGRTDLGEAVRPTEPAAVIPEETHESIPADNATVVENVRDVSGEHQEDEHHVPVVVPTELPQSQPEEIEETTEIPQPVVPAVTPEEVPVPAPEEEKKSVEEEHVHEEEHVPAVVPAVDDEEATTAVSGDDSNEVPTTVAPEFAEQSESEHGGESHDITPMDVLSFSSSTQGSTSTTTPSSPVVVPIQSEEEEEQSQGRSVSSSSSVEAAEISDEVESVTSGAAISTDQGSVRSQNLSQDDNSEGVTEVNGNREARLLSTEVGNGNSLQLLAGDQEKSAEREEPIVPVEIPQVEPQQELPRASQNVTESASVETADENPETASAVTKTSSEDVTADDGASREAATVPMTENESSQSQSGSNENSNNNNVSSQNIFGSSSSSSSDSESSEVSQESPVVVRQPDSDSGERTTFAPLSLHHDIDINYLGNNTEDHQNSEPVVQVQPDVETFEGENVANHETEKISDKLITAPEEDQAEATTTAPSLAEREELASQEENSQVPTASGESKSADDNTEQVSTNGESSESADEPTGTTTRGITSSSELFNNEDAFESPNRDHRDANADIETPFIASREASQDEEIVTTAEPPVVSSTASTTTTTSTTTTEATTTTSTTETPTTTTTTTTAAPPVPEITLADVITTSTTTTTTTSPAAEVASTNDTQSSSILSDSNSNSDSLSQESISGSPEESSSSHLNSHEGFPSSSSPEEKSSVSEPTLSAASYEVGQSSSPSLDSHDSSSSSTDEDLHHNELT